MLPFYCNKQCTLHSLIVAWWHRWCLSSSSILVEVMAWHQAIISINSDLLAIVPSGINFSKQIIYKLFFQDCCLGNVFGPLNFSKKSAVIRTFKKMYLKMFVKWQQFCSGLNESNHCRVHGANELISPWTKWPPFSQMIFSDTFSWMKSLVFWSKIHRKLFLRFQLTINQHWFR